MARLKEYWMGKIRYSHLGKWIRFPKTMNEVGKIWADKAGLATEEEIHG